MNEKLGVTHDIVALIRQAGEIYHKHGAYELFCKSLRLFLLSLLAHPLVAPIKLRSELRRVDSNDIEGLVDLAFKFNFLGLTIRPLQVREEIVELLKRLRYLRPRNVLEIGTLAGGTLFLFAQVCGEGASIISVDLPPIPSVYQLTQIRLFSSFTRYKSQRIFLLRSNSHDPSTLKEVKNILKGQALDFLFIDGDHRYESVKKDFEMYSPLVKEGGMVALHDIVPGAPENVNGVPRFWSEIKNSYRHLEIVKDWKQGWCGIGVIYL